MQKTTPKKEPSERSFSFKGMPDYLYKKIVLESIETGLSMKAVVFQILEEYFSPDIHWHIEKVPEELDEALKRYAHLKERTLEEQVIADLCEMYDIKEPE